MAEKLHIKLIVSYSVMIRKIDKQPKTLELFAAYSSIVWSLIRNLHRVCVCVRYVGIIKRISKYS